MFIEKAVPLKKEDRLVCGRSRGSPLSQAAASLKVALRGEQEEGRGSVRALWREIMLSRHSSCLESGMDRGRIGERLRAALAGLQELRMLKERQRDMVGWALGMDREEPVTSVQSEPDGARVMGSEEQRLEATLTALKQQLSRLRKQDVGLKTHLHELDQQINELKLDVSKVSSEQLECDSRPSSGFYELSDAGSCSRSNSCTSVYSECLSSSQTSLIPMSPVNSHIGPPPQADVYQQRCADESSAQPTPVRATGLHLGSSRIRASAAGSEQSRPRPVSTGDLDRMVGQGLAHLKSVDPKRLRTSTVDPKFQRNLESRCGGEVFPYPSPLHAVALQSPMFSPAGDAGFLNPLENQRAPVNDLDSHLKGYEPTTLTYIGKLLQRNPSKEQIETDTDTVKSFGSCHGKPTKSATMSTQVSQTEVFVHPSAKSNGFLPVSSDQKGHGLKHSIQELADNRNLKQTMRVSDPTCQYSCSPAMKECHSENLTSSLKKNDEKPKEEKLRVQRNCCAKACGDPSDPRLQERKTHRQRPVLAHSCSAGEERGFEAQSGHIGSPEFVHAKFLPARSQKVKIRQADRKSKAVKLKRRSCDKHRALRHQHGCSSGERAGETSSRPKGEPRRTGKTKKTSCIDTCHAEGLIQGSGSDSSLCSHGLIATCKASYKPHLIPAVQKPNKSRRAHCHEHVQLVEQRKKRQTGPKWSSTVDVLQTHSAQRQRSKEQQAQVLGKMQLVQSLNGKQVQVTRPRPVLQSSVSSNSFLYNQNARYPAAPFYVSTHYPPRCESEYSAECASLFHSTIVESSEGEMSDNTTNRFGDSESSQSFQSLSDSDSSLSLDEDDIQVEQGGLVWANASPGPAGHPYQPNTCHPEPPAFRIKASRALKKKIRRFQPASLKVMTLV